MNDQHAHTGYAAHDGYSPGGFEADPLFGALPGDYETGQPADHGGRYDAPPWDTGNRPTATYDMYAAPQYDTGGPWAADAGAGPLGPTGQHPPGHLPGQAEQHITGQWDAVGWDAPEQPGGTAGPGGSAPVEATPYGYEPTAQFDVSQLQTAPYAYEATTQWMAPGSETGAYDATAWNSVQDTVMAEAVVPGQLSPETAVEHGQRYESEPAYQPPDPAYDPRTAHEPADGTRHDGEPEAVPDHLAMTQTALAVIAAPGPGRRDTPAGGNGNRGRRRTPARRSALLTIAVPSACVMGVAGIAAASVGGLGTTEEKHDDTKSLAAADPSAVKPVAANNKMDTQLAALSADARDFGDRAGRTQERLDLKARQDADKKKRVDDAARKEALRPKFVIPVTQHGLSAYFGQAGVNWMSVHTGIDFPVSYGTPVMAATDGNLRTQWNSAYGNMAILTSPDGTETWYCHLSSTKIRSGSVKAGEVIAFSGNSGNSTGPHLHFEVRPGAGAAIDPLPWLRGHGLDPT